MDTHAVYEGAMRLLAAECSHPSRLWAVSDEDIGEAVDIAARAWKAAYRYTGEANRTVTREVTR